MRGDRSGRITGFDHVSLPMQHTDAMVAFYRSLGFLSGWLDGESATNDPGESGMRPAVRLDGDAPTLRSTRAR